MGRALRGCLTVRAIGCPIPREHRFEAARGLGALRLQAKQRAFGVAPLAARRRFFGRSRDGAGPRGADVAGGVDDLVGEADDLLEAPDAQRVPRRREVEVDVAEEALDEAIEEAVVEGADVGDELGVEGVAPGGGVELHETFIFNPRAI
jgi:hypothetical protein